MGNEKANKRTLRHSVWCDMCEEHMKPTEDEMCCPDCESYLGETEAQVARDEQ